MKRSIICMVFTMSIASSQSRNDLLRDLDSLCAESGGAVSIAAEHLDTGERILISENDMYHAASTMKTPVMIEVFRQAAEGKFRLDDSIVVRNDFRSIVDGSPYSMDLGEDSDDSVYNLIGKPATILFLIRHMITVSSNLATNILIELVDARKVTETMRTLGAKDMNVLRGVEDGKAFQKGLNNETNAIDLMTIFKAIAEGKAVGAEEDKAMVDMLLAQRFRSKIPALLPEGVRVAHKTGNITGVEHDSGIVFLPDGTQYVVVILMSKLKENATGVRVAAKISRRIYDYFAQGH
ncbi:MAG: serine hydrolase [Ignavibacteria bacterium RIFCSPHIGHO2_02_FULL_56_12]|nr:MAG: serine hydrolase [Ignavibacteria bacterium RIFCSPHIGHO2_02_FULL_56_12]